MSILYNIKSYTLKYKKSFVTYKDIGNIYDQLSKTHSSSKSSGFLENYNNILSLENLNNLKILEIGCGDGNFSNLIPDDSLYIGIDISNEMINQAKKINKRNRNNVFFEKVNAHDFIKYSPKNSFNIIIFSFSSKYFNQDFQNKILDLLSEDGFLILIDDFKENFKELFSLYDEYKENNHNSFIQINPFMNYFEDSDSINLYLTKLGYRQTIFLTFEREISEQFAYLNNSGIIPELISEFNNSDLHLNAFNNYLKENNFVLKNQKYFFCIAKK